MIKKQIDLLREFKKFTKEMEIPCIYGKQEHAVNNLLFTSSPFSLEFKVNSNMIVVDFDSVDKNSSIYENEKAYKIYTASENHSRETEESYKYTNDKEFDLENLIHFFSYKLYRD